MSTDADVFTPIASIPPHAPVVIVLIEMEGCPACEEYHPTFIEAARRLQLRTHGIPVVRVDAASEDNVEQLFMTRHGVQATPTVVVSTFRRGPIDTIEGVETKARTEQLMNTAISYQHGGFWPQWLGPQPRW